MTISPKYKRKLTLSERRKSHRHPTHDYRATRYYFVTIQTIAREVHFDIPFLHDLLEKTWHSLPTYYPGVTLDEFIIMPDHVHCIIHLTRQVGKSPTLGNVVKTFKSIVTVTWTEHIEKTGLDMQYPGSFWQVDFYDHIVRDEKIELSNIRRYIRENPQKLLEKQKRAYESRKRRHRR